MPNPLSKLTPLAAAIVTAIVVGGGTYAAMSWHRADDRGWRGAHRPPGMMFERDRFGDGNRPGEPMGGGPGDRGNDHAASPMGGGEHSGDDSSVDGERRKLGLRACGAPGMRAMDGGPLGGSLEALAISQADVRAAVASALKTLVNREAITQKQADELNDRLTTMQQRREDVRERLSKRSDCNER